MNQGIDRGTTKIRKITIKSGWGGLKAVSSGKPGKSILLLPSRYLTFRKFEMPFNDKKRIMEVLPGELMESLLIPIDNAVWGIPSFFPGGVNALITTREKMDAFLQSSPNSIFALDAEPCALSRVAKYNKIEDCLVIDLGASKTTFCGIREGKVDLLRVRNLGGNKISETLSKITGISYEKAEELKINEGLNNRNIHSIMVSLLDSSLLFQNKFQYEKIIITGGGSLMPGLADLLREKSGVEVSFFSLPQGLSPNFDVNAFGAALYDIVGEEKINLKEETRKEMGLSFVWSLLFLIPLILFSLGLKVEESLITKENKQLNNLMITALRREMPEITGVVAPVSQAKAQLDKVKGVSGEGGRKITEILTIISNAKGKLDISVYSLDISQAEIKIQGESATVKDVENLRQALANNFASAEIIEQKIKPSGRYDFNIKMAGGDKPAPEKQEKTGEQ